MSNRHRIGILALLLTLLGAAHGAAAEATPDHRHRARARTFLAVRLAEELNLPEDKALELSGILRKSDEQRLTLRERRHEVETKIKAALDHAAPDSVALDKLIAEANEIDQQVALLPEQSVREAQKILTSEQQARLILLRPELQQRIQHAVRRRFGERLRERFGRQERPLDEEAE